MFQINRLPAAGIWILCYLLWFIGNIGCKKNATDIATRLQQSSNDDSLPVVAPKGYLIISPAKSDTGVDINSGIVIKGNSSMDVLSFNILSLSVRKGSEIVPGKIESSDTLVMFIPDNALEKFTTYNIHLNGIINIHSDIEVEPTFQVIEEKYSFITAAREPEYLMTRQSTQVTDFARDGSSMMQMGDYLYLYGGWTGTGSWNDIYRSNGDLSVWEKMPDAPWGGRHTFGIGKLGSGLYIFGGDYNNDLFDVWKSNDGLNFQPVANNLETTIKRRIIYGTCTHNNKLFVLGGQSSIDYLDAGLNDVWSSSNGLAWKKIADDKTFLGKNISGCVTSFNGKIWVVGGGYYRHPDSAVRWTNHIYSSSDGIEWERENDAPWAGRQYADVGVWDNRLWMVGGNNGKNLDEIWYMNKDGSWVQYIPPNLFTARHATAIATYNNKLVLGCGDYNNECWVIEKN